MARAAGALWPGPANVGPGCFCGAPAGLFGGWAGDCVVSFRHFRYDNKEYYCLPPVRLAVRQRQAKRLQDAGLGRWREGQLRKNSNRQRRKEIRRSGKDIIGGQDYEQSVDSFAHYLRNCCFRSYSYKSVYSKA